jgi:5-methyltetrahydropteroyltriglutamate--homocysteine methyltransferase
LRSTTAWLERFSPAERERLGVHTCPGGDRDSTHSADVDYAELLPSLFELEVGNFYVQLASERDRRRVLGIISECLRPEQTVFVGVTDPIATRLTRRSQRSRTTPRRRLS